MVCIKQQFPVSGWKCMLQLQQWGLSNAPMTREITVSNSQSMLQWARNRLLWHRWAPHVMISNLQELIWMHVFVINIGHIVSHHRHPLPGDWMWVEYTASNKWQFDEEWKGHWVNWSISADWVEDWLWDKKLISDSRGPDFWPIILQRKQLPPTPFGACWAWINQ